VREAEGRGEAVAYRDSVQVDLVLRRVLSHRA
jgi:hypothetical protein